MTDVSNVKKKLQGHKEPVNSGDTGSKEPGNSADKGVIGPVATPPIGGGSSSSKPLISGSLLEQELQKLGIDEENVTRLVGINQKEHNNKKKNGDDEDDGDDDDDEAEVECIGSIQPHVSSSNNAKDFLKAFSNALSKSIKDDDSEPLPQNEVASRIYANNLDGIDASTIPHGVLKKCIKDNKALLALDIRYFKPGSIVDYDNTYSSKRTQKVSYDGELANDSAFQFADFLQCLIGWVVACTICGFNVGTCISHQANVIGIARQRSSRVTGLVLGFYYDRRLRTRLFQEAVTYDKDLHTTFKQLSWYDHNLEASLLNDATLSSNSNTKGKPSNGGYNRNWSSWYSNKDYYGKSWYGDSRPRGSKDDSGKTNNANYYNNNNNKRGRESDGKDNSNNNNNKKSRRDDVSFNDSDTTSVIDSHSKKRVNPCRAVEFEQSIVSASGVLDQEDKLLRSKEVALSDLVLHLQGSSSPDPRREDVPPRNLEQAIYYFTPRVSKIGAVVQPKATEFHPSTETVSLTAANHKDHLETALDEPHPLSEFPGLPDTISAAIDAHARIGVDNLPKFRQSITEFWDKRVEDTLKDNDVILESMPPELYRICKNLNLALMKEMLIASGYQDTQLVDDLARGLPLSGEFKTPPAVFREANAKEKRLASIPLEDLLKDGRKQAKRLAKKICRKSSEFDDTLWNSAVDEVQAGSMCGPFSMDDIDSMFDEYVCSRRFGLDQGSKIRPIDDFKASSLNKSMTFFNKLSFPTCDSTLAVARLYAKVTGCKDLRLWKSDHASAYRQVPCSPESYKLSVILIKEPVSGLCKAFFHTGQPFGAASSVINYCRVSQALSHLGRVIFGIPLLNYLDDYYSLESAVSAQSAYDSWLWLHNRLGWVLKEAKCVPPRRDLSILGIVISVNDEELSLSVPADKRQSILAQLQLVIKNGTLHHSEGQKLIGKLTFICSAFESSAVRPYLRELLNYINHRYRFDSLELPLEVSDAISEISNMLSSGKSHRKLPLLHSICSDFNKAILYTDASGSAGLGAVIHAKDFPKPMYISCVMPDAALSSLNPRENNIAAFELYAVRVAVESFAKYIKGRWLTIFVDNEVVRYTLIKGSSAESDLASMTHKFWHSCLSLGLKVWIERVPSQLNIADLPSRRMFGGPLTNYSRKKALFPSTPV
ncbi:hypothetical protein FOL47_008665 [Perkinsus chesapeaki]|uniref:Reverse transcriptase RNase H-like domain-containing protein n=1 Tax=Perkinsus chesapeaki TaxID=330153 RepID=A0A7J6LCU6_PERCH|nr:hypothetical protein FOL47_008665 [Perkinsus chesapeaki]